MSTGVTLFWLNMKSLQTDVEALWEMEKPRGRGPGGFKHMCTWYFHNTTECVIMDNWVTKPWIAGARLAFLRKKKGLETGRKGVILEGRGGGLIEKDSLKFECSGGLKTRGRCERMPGSLDKGPGCPSLAVRGPQENRRRVGPFYKRGLGEWRGGPRIKNRGGGGGLQLQ